MIRYIILIENQVYFYGEKWEVKYFEEHLHAYAVQRTENCFCTAVENLADYHPLHLNVIGQHEKHYVILRHEIL